MVFIWFFIWFLSGFLSGLYMVYIWFIYIYRGFHKWEYP
jgi:hypothetical protein